MSTELIDILAIEMPLLKQLARRLQACFGSHMRMQRAPK